MSTPTITPVDDSAIESTGPDVAAEAVEQDLLVEDVSIDGMCGVY